MAALDADVDRPISRSGDFDARHVGRRVVVGGAEVEADDRAEDAGKDEKDLPSATKTSFEFLRIAAAEKRADDQQPAEAEHRDAKREDEDRPRRLDGRVGRGPAE